MDAPPQSESELTRFSSAGPTRASTLALLLALLPVAASAQGEGDQPFERTPFESDSYRRFQADKLWTLVPALFLANTVK